MSEKLMQYRENKFKTENEIYIKYVDESNPLKRKEFEKIANCELSEFRKINTYKVINC